jgi:spore coat protein CotH
MSSVKMVKLRWRDRWVTGLWGVGAALLLAAGMPEARGAKKDSLTPSELFSTTNVYTAHFQFTAEQWDAMEPEQGENIFRGGPPRGGRPGRMQFGPGMFLGPAILRAGDENRDRKLSAAEFEALGARWFTAWDKDGRGKLDGDELRDGMNGSFGGPGGPGGLPRLQLQGEEGKRNGLAAAMGIEFDYVKADLEFADRKFTNVAVRYKGNGTWMMSQGSLKRSMKVDLNEFVKGQKIAGISKLNFHNAVTDASWMNEVLSHAFFRDAGVAAPKTAYARVYVSVPGKFDRKYLGLYSVVENIDNNFTDERFGTRKGTIFKPVTPELFADLGDDWTDYKQTYDPKDDPSAADQKRVMAFAKLVTHASDKEFAAKLPEFLDLKQFAGFMAGTVWLSTLDSILGPGQNYYMYLDHKTRQFQFFPWDLDHSFGQFFLMGDQKQRNELSIQKPWRGENRFLERVFKVEEFQALYRAKLKEINETIGRPERITRQVDEIAAAIRPAVKEEAGDRLARFEKAAAGEMYEPLMMGPGGGPRGMNMEIQPIKKFAVERHRSIGAQLSGESPGADIDAPPPGMGRNMGPGTFLGPALMAKFDRDQNGELMREEFVGGFSKWFAAWDTEDKEMLTEEEVVTALNNEFAPPGAGVPPGGGGPGRPPERPR